MTQQSPHPNPVPQGLEEGFILTGSGFSQLGLHGNGAEHDEEAFTNVSNVSSV